MNKISERLDAVLAERDSNLWFGYVNMLKILASVFQSPRHWVLEFLQNAEDAKAQRFSVVLGADALNVLNSGNVFTDDDFHAICDVASRKAPSLGFLGYLGIGFKSIFRITDEVYVHSGDYHFGFNKEHWREKLLFEGTSVANYPWEVLPVEVPPLPIPQDYTTLFHIPLGNDQGQEMLQELETFFAGDKFSNEAILLLKNVESIEIETSKGHKSITKRTIKEYTTKDGLNLAKVAVTEKDDEGKVDETHYQVVRRVITVPPEVLQDEQTERVRRQDVKEREIGLVFGLDNTGGYKKLEGKLGGVYSFLPVEGEQTGLPFGVFGDFIPIAGRDLINYGARWNEWIAGELVGVFADWARHEISSGNEWYRFCVEILDYSLERRAMAGQGENFWEGRLREPIRTFLRREERYPDGKGEFWTKEELIAVDLNVLKLVDKEFIEEVYGKHLADESVYHRLGPIISFVDLLADIRFLKHLKDEERLNDEPPKLAQWYSLIRNESDYLVRGRDGRGQPMSKMTFVLGVDEVFHTPAEVMMLDIDLDQIPPFLKSIMPEGKTPLHPEVAQHNEAVDQLFRCGMDQLNIEDALSLLVRKLNSIRSDNDAPDSWTFPEDLVSATHFLVAKSGELPRSLNRILTQSKTLDPATNLFVPEAELDWMPLYEDNLLPGWEPVLGIYLGEYQLRKNGLQREKLLAFFKSLGVHGFTPQDDTGLIDTAAMAIAKQELRKSGHHPEDVSRHNELGYDLECMSHCDAVFEVKGMGSPGDIDLPASETRAAKEKGGNFHLVFVHNLPADTSSIGYKVVKDPNGKGLLEAVDRARVIRDKWIYAS